MSLLYYRAVAPTHDTDRTAGRETADGIAHRFGNQRIFGPVDDRCQGAVVVEKHGRLSAGELLDELILITQSVWDRANLTGHRSSSITLFERNLGKVTHNQVGPMLAQRLHVILTRNPEHQTESAGLASGNPGNRIFHHHCPFRRNA
jgi:hypothetical protein